MSQFECGYCGAPWEPVRETIVSADENDEDRVYEGDMCPHCGEFNGKAPSEDAL